jgi:ribonuclease P protein component
MLGVTAGFPRDFRLLKAAEYRSVFSHPSKSTDRYFTVLCRPNGRTSARLGLVVAKKKTRLAVDRNRIKRIIRESFRHNRVILGGVDFVVLSRMGAGDVKNQTLFDSLERHWDKLSKVAPGKDV